jgi:hypothetical protein
MTMIAGALLGVEALSVRKTIGVLQAASRWRSLRASAPRPKAPGATT